MDWQPAPHETRAMLATARRLARHCRGAVEPDDLLQVMRVALWRSHSQRERLPHSPLSSAYRACKWAACDELDRMRVRDHVEFTEDMAEAETRTPERIAAARSVLARAERVLPAAAMRALYAFAEHGGDSRAAGRSLGLSSDTITYHVRAARARLAPCI